MYYIINFKDPALPGMSMQALREGLVSRMIDGMYGEDIPQSWIAGKDQLVIETPEQPHVHTVIAMAPAHFHYALVGKGISELAPAEVQALLDEEDATESSTPLFVLISTHLRELASSMGWPVSVAVTVPGEELEYIVFQYPDKGPVAAAMLLNMGGTVFNAEETAALHEYIED